MATIAYPHLDSDAAGRAIVAGTTTRVSEIVLDHLAHRWSPEDIAREHPHLNLAQIHAAFAYYYDHQSEVDAEIAESVRTAEELHAQSAPSRLRARLLASRTEK